MTGETEGQATELAYLLLDDHPTRTRIFKEQVSGGALSVNVIWEAIELEPLRHDLEVLDGIIVDFHLNTPKRPGYRYLSYPCTNADCPDVAVNPDATDEAVAAAHAEHAWHASTGIPTVDVTTGLGAMLYVKQHAPNTALFGFCEANADHSLLFLCAAHTWLGASAVNAEYAPEQIRRALTSEVPEVHLPIHRQLMEASKGFKKLTDSLAFLTRDAEAFDWLDLYRQCGANSTLAEFKYLLRQHYGRRTLEGDVYVQIVGTWQAALHHVLTSFDRDVSGWPDLRHVDGAAYWNYDNPVLDFLKNADYRTFFTAPDMRAALAYYRANEARRKAEDPYGVLP